MHTNSLYSTVKTKEKKKNEDNSLFPTTGDSNVFISQCCVFFPILKRKEKYPATFPSPHIP